MFSLSISSILSKISLISSFGVSLFIKIISCDTNPNLSFNVLFAEILSSVSGNELSSL